MAERLIDAEALVEKIKEKIDVLERDLLLDKGSWLSSIRLVWFKRLFIMVEAIPTIEAKPVVYGKWEVVSTEKDKWVNKCTACGAYLERGYKQTNYCPNCGAKMFGKEGE